MLKEETLSKTERRTYEEPDGEFLELIETGNNTITVLTRVNSDNPAPPIDPTEYNVADLKDELRERDLSDAERDAILEAEIEADHRTTAVTAIKDS